jgi:hypothetical protein
VAGAVDGGRPGRARWSWGTGGMIAVNVVLLLLAAGVAWGRLGSCSVGPTRFCGSWEARIDRDHHAGRRTQRALSQ